MEVQEAWDMIPPHDHISLDFVPDVVGGDDLWVSKRRPVSHTDLPLRVPVTTFLTPTASELQAQGTGVIPGADVLAYASGVPKPKPHKRGCLTANDAEAVAKAKEDILGIVEALDSQLQLGGPDHVWRAMGLTRRREQATQLWNAFQARHASEGLGDLSPQVYKEKAHADYDAWKLGLDALDPVARTSEESELLTWHERNILETEVASVQLPGGRVKKMEKIKSEMGEQASFNLLNFGIFTVSFVVNVGLGDVAATEANGVVHPSKLSHTLFSEKHPHIQEYLNTLAGGLSADIEEMRYREATETVKKTWWTPVQKDQRENVSKYLMQMWNTACADKYEHWTKPSYAHVQHKLYKRQWCIVDYPDNTRPLSREVTNRTLHSRELRALLHGFDSLNPPRIIPWDSTRTVKDGVNVPLKDLGDLPLVQTHSGSTVLWVHECSAWATPFGKLASEKTLLRRQRRMTRRDSQLNLSKGHSKKRKRDGDTPEPPPRKNMVGATTPPDPHRYLPARAARPSLLVEQPHDSPGTDVDTPTSDFVVSETSTLAQVKKRTRHDSISGDDTPDSQRPASKKYKDASLSHPKRVRKTKKA
ncbi:hypothetical protein BS47DRAFT_1402205 [Hydnum rufescens UP504]|uniref:Uncharacterized protein n=1 Tax=Hydnum rufescens UP504 TaxID=1448309 RepID=A0A9P6DLX0_9AGAM|nr:hypothetical protein BS47DRAFT_1402205 [Hydnum rufescens UP504]